jgi:hypothetical protein
MGSVALPSTERRPPPEGGAFSAANAGPYQHSVKWLRRAAPPYSLSAKAVASALGEAEADQLHAVTLAQQAPCELELLSN